MPVVHLTDRALIRVHGPDARHFLHNILTCNVADLPEGGARYGALLFPQGKIIADFLLYDEGGDSFLLDAPQSQAADLLKRLGFYKLRAQVTCEAADGLAVAAVFGGAAAPEGRLFPDPRLEALGGRLILPAEAAAALSDDASAYEAHRIDLGIPKGGPDFAYGDAFPHEADMDQLGGVDFKKGCYVGQEVVARMQHRGTARTRAVQALLDAAPAPGSEIMAGEKTVGRVGSAAAGTAIALVRLDRAADAKAAGIPLLAGGHEVKLRRPQWATFAMDAE